MRAAAAPDDARTVAQVLEVLPRMVHLLRQATATDGAEPLTLTQYRLLQRLVQRVCLTSDLAADLAVKPATVSAAIDCLVRRGFVERRPSTGDRREIPLAATAAGRTAVEAAGLRQREALSVLLDALTAVERDALAVAIGALGRTLDARHGR